MTDEELEALLDELEASLTADVQAALSLTAQDFADAVDSATELVAARFGVSRVGAMWRRRVSGLMTKLRSIVRRGAQVAADGIGEELPDAWENQLGSYVEATTALLNAVGDRMAEAATSALAEGLDAGESTDELKERMLALFADTGTQLGPGRAERIAMTEATRAWNAGTLAAAQSLTGPDRPLVKQWTTRRDTRVREPHADTDGQLQFLDDPFDVAGTPMQYPGDPSAPAALTVNCRCILRASAAPAPGQTEGDDVTADLTAATDEVHTGAMIALMPTEEDAARLALEGGEPADQLHLTLFYLGDAVEWGDDERAELVAGVAAASRLLGPVEGNVFGGAQWNPGGEDPAWVWNVGHPMGYEGTRMADARYEAQYALENRYGGPDLPEQHEPWSPHICAQYSADNLSEALADRVGPVTFDRIRVVFGGDSYDFRLSAGDAVVAAPLEADQTVPVPDYAFWSTPGSTALAFENQQTGDGRVFATGALYWEGDGPWPLKLGHDSERELAGAIYGMYRDGGRIAGEGLLYYNSPDGYTATTSLAKNSPLGVSVDLDDLDYELVVPDESQAVAYKGRFVTASVLPLDDGYIVKGQTEDQVHASSDGVAATSVSRTVTYRIDSDGKVAGESLSAAAGDGAWTDGVVVDRRTSGDFLMRITRARIRGASLVTIPAFDGARIVLESPELYASQVPDEDEVSAALKSETSYDRVLRHVRRSNQPVGAARLAQFLKMPLSAAQRLLAQAASRGEVVRLTRGLYTDKTTSARADHVMMDDLTASVTGRVDLPVADRDTEWDGDAAKSRVFDWATSDGVVDTDKVAQAFAYRDDDADGATKAAWKLGYADVQGDRLVIVPKGVSAAIGAVNGARGGVDIPEDELDAVAERLEEVRAHVSEETSEEDMQASAWAALQQFPPMPASWFAEPTEEELPPGGPGVNYSNGRIFGWVAQAGEPHAGFAKKITIDGLGRIDTSHFLRQRFELDDGTTVKAGAYTMNVGHHRDGAECETSACQFDDTRTVAGIVTVGMNARGMWFSGAAAPWLSEWDRQVFAATQPSYHMRKGRDGKWQLRAVLSVPVPGHSSPLLASAVVERSQLALTAAATMVEVEEAVAVEIERQAADELTQHDQDAGLYNAPLIDYDRLAAAIVSAQTEAEERKQREAAEAAELIEFAAKLDVDTTGLEGI